MSTVESSAGAPTAAIAYQPPVIVTAGAVVGRVIKVSEHPSAERIWLARVDLGVGLPVQIVFGGKYRVQPDELVPVAPPGSLAMVVPGDGLAIPRIKKMRCRRYRGERSYGMLCSLEELGWVVGGSDEVAVLRGVSPGDSLDDLPAERQGQVIVTSRLTLVELLPQGEQTRESPQSTWAVRRGASELLGVHHRVVNN